MCPLRVILLFLSAMLAGYFALKSVQSDGDSSILTLREEETEQAMEETSLLTKVQYAVQSLTWNVDVGSLPQEGNSLLGCKKVSTSLSSGFWVMIDMLSGRYLYQNLKGQAQGKGKGEDASIEATS